MIFLWFGESLKSLSLNEQQSTRVLFQCSNTSKAFSFSAVVSSERLELLHLFRASEFRDHPDAMLAFCPVNGPIVSCRAAISCNEALDIRCVCGTDVARRIYHAWHMWFVLVCVNKRHSVDLY